jgi:hypothetical protein
MASWQQRGRNLRVASFGHGMTALAPQIANTLQERYHNQENVVMPAKLAAALIGSAIALAATSGAHALDYKPKDVYVEPAPKAKAYKKGPRRHDDGIAFIHVESHHGKGDMIVPVREGRHGQQVRLPGGNWVYCEITCEYTVRRLSLDFWEGQGQNFTSPGYFRKRFSLDRY